MNETPSENASTTPPQQSSSVPLVILFWLFAGTPLGWGVYNTLKQAIKLFQ